MINPILKKIRKDVISSSAYHVQNAENMIKLDSMENPYKLPAKSQKKLGKILGAANINRYPANEVVQLEKAIAEYAQIPENFGIVLGNGSDELITLLAVALDISANTSENQNNKRATILAPAPSFVMYEISAKWQGLNFETVQLDKNFELNADKFCKAINEKKPALVYIAHPNNPTGTLWSEKAIKQIISCQTEQGGLIIIDEAYQPFASRTWLNNIKQKPENNTNVLIMRTLSKFGLAGARIGYLIGDKNLTEQINKVRPPYNISVLNALCGIFALENQEIFKKQAEKIKEQREKIQKSLSKIKNIKYYKSQGNMILVRVADTKDKKAHEKAQFIFEQMKNDKILIKNASKMHPLLAGCLRFTIGKPSENKQMMQSFKTAIEKLQK